VGSTNVPISLLVPAESTIENLQAHGRRWDSWEHAD
jgi:hypothetical protein